MGLLPKGLKSFRVGLKTGLSVEVEVPTSASNQNKFLIPDNPFPVH
jgi:hypothetical protein